jgi:hypothetical protein
VRPASSGIESILFRSPWMSSNPGGRAPGKLPLTSTPMPAAAPSAREVFSRAADRGEAPAMADLDSLGAAWPTPADDPFQHRLKARNLAAVWSNFRDTGGEQRVGHLTQLGPVRWWLSGCGPMLMS